MGDIQLLKKWGKVMFKENEEVLIQAKVINPVNTICTEVDFGFVKAHVENDNIIPTSSTLVIPLKFNKGDKAVKYSRGDYAFVTIDSVNKVEIELDKLEVYYSVSNEYIKITNIVESKLLTLEEFGNKFKDMK